MKKQYDDYIKQCLPIKIILDVAKLHDARKYVLLQPRGSQNFSDFFDCNSCRFSKKFKNAKTLKFIITFNKKTLPYSINSISKGIHNNLIDFLIKKLRSLILFNILNKFNPLTICLASIGKYSKADFLILQFFSFKSS